MLRNMHFQSLIANGMMAVFGMITLSILYRSLSVVDIGIYIFFLALIGLQDTLRAGFLTITIVKFFSGTEKKRENEVAGSGWALSLMISGVLLVLNAPAFFLSNRIDDQGFSLFLKYFGLISIITLPSFMADCVVQASKRFDRLLWMRIVNQGSYTITILALAYFEKLTLESVLYTYLLSNTFSSLIVMALNWGIVSSLRHARLDTMKEMFHFGKYSLGTNISSNLFSVTNTLVINFLIGPAALAMYNLGGKLLQIIEIPLLSFAATGMPLLSSHYNKGENEQMMYTLKKLVGILTIALIPVVIFAIIFAGPLIHLVGGKSYVDNEAPNLFRIFLLIALLYPADRFFALAIDVIHLPKINFYKIIGMLIVNIIAVFVAMGIYHSIYSIAIASIVPTLVAILITYFPLNNFQKFNFLSIYRVGLSEGLLLVKQTLKSFRVQ